MDPMTIEAQVPPAIAAEIEAGLADSGAWIKSSNRRPRTTGHQRSRPAD